MWKDIRLLSVASFVFLTGCSSSLVPSATPISGAALAAQLAGGWTQQGLVIGSALSVDLTPRDTTLNGTGHYALEAGRTGTVTVAGLVSASIVHLDFAYDSGTGAQFDGTLRDSETLVGSMRYGPPGSLGPAASATFARRRE